MTIHEPPAETVRLTQIELAAARLSELLALASQVALPVPHYVSVHAHGAIYAQFPPVMASVRSVALWATTFYGDVSSTTHEGENGPEIWPTAQFNFNGVSVTAYAHVSVPEQGPADPVLQHADYPHEPGRLYGCPACEARCYCTPGAAECVFDGPHIVPDDGDGGA